MTSGLLGLAADVGWPDAPSPLPPGRVGRLDAAVAWFAATQGAASGPGLPAPPARPRLITIDTTAVPADVTDAAGLGVRPVGRAPSDVAGAIAAGAQAADEEVDAGADLIIVTAGGWSPEAAALVSALTGTEPVAVLPRDGLDVAGWTDAVVAVRTRRRTLIAHRADPDALALALSGWALPFATGMLLRAAARRTAILLDGPAAAAAALLAHAAQPRAARWWQPADEPRDPSTARACAAMQCAAVLDLGLTAFDGRCGALAVMALRVALSPRESPGADQPPHRNGPTPLSSEVS